MHSIIICYTTAIRHFYLALYFECSGKISDIKHHDVGGKVLKHLQLLICWQYYKIKIPLGNVHEFYNDGITKNIVQLYSYLRVSLFWAKSINWIPAKLASCRIFVIIVFVQSKCEPPHRLRVLGSYIQTQTAAISSAYIHQKISTKLKVFVKSRADSDSYHNQ